MCKDCNKLFTVYMHTFPNNKKYIGITCQKVEYRWRSDGSGYRPHSKAKPNSSKIWNAILKYGWENVKHEILFTQLSKEEACKKEKELIQQYKTTLDEFGYNISLGGDVAFLSDDTKRKISDAHKGNNYGYIGKNHPLYGKSLSEERRKKISESLIGNTRHMSKHHTQEFKAKMRENKKDMCKKVVQLDKYSGEIINTFPSIHYASEQTGTNRMCLSFCLQGKYKTAGGYKWKYAS